MGTEGTEIKGWITCPHCGKQFNATPQKPLKFIRTEANRRTLSQQASDRWSLRRHNLGVGKQAGFNIDPQREASPRSSTYRYLAEMCRLLNYELHTEGKTGLPFQEEDGIALHYFEPWKAHKPFIPRSIYVDVFGHSPDDRREGLRLFGEDFGLEVKP